jgi:hypothetical protein
MAFSLMCGKVVSGKWLGVSTIVQADTLADS